MLIIQLRPDPSDAQSWYLLGCAYMAGQKYNKAYKAYQQAVCRNGRNPTFWCSIGVLYFQINQFHDALDTVEDGTFTWTRWWRKFSIGLGWGSAILGASFAIYLHSSPLTDLHQPSLTQEYLCCAIRPHLCLSLSNSWSLHAGHAPPPPPRPHLPQANSVNHTYSHAHTQSYPCTRTQHGSSKNTPTNRPVLTVCWPLMS
jgi:hypothetical protein